jgi:hypothetical protein
MIGHQVLGTEMIGTTMLGTEMLGTEMLGHRIDWRTNARASNDAARMMLRESSVSQFSSGQSISGQFPQSTRFAQSEA